MAGEKFTLECSEEELAAIDASWESYRVANTERVFNELKCIFTTKVFEDFQKSEMISNEITEDGITYGMIATYQNGKLIFLKEYRKRE